MSIETDEVPWVKVSDVCSHYGVTYPTSLNKIRAGTFPVPTYKVGGFHVIDKAVHEEYFRLKREAGLRAMKTTKG